MNEPDPWYELLDAAEAVAFADLRPDMENGEQIVLSWDTNVDDWKRLRAAIKAVDERRWSR